MSAWVTRHEGASEASVFAASAATKAARSVIRREGSEGMGQSETVNTPFANCVANCWRFEGAGPDSTCPLVSYREPWQGQT